MRHAPEVLHSNNANVQSRFRYYERIIALIVDNYALKIEQVSKQKILKTEK